MPAAAERADVGTDKAREGARTLVRQLVESNTVARLVFVVAAAAGPSSPAVVPPRLRIRNLHRAHFAHSFAAASELSGEAVAEEPVHRQSEASTAVRLVHGPRQPSTQSNRTLAVGAVVVDQWEEAAEVDMGWA